MKVTYAPIVSDARGRFGGLVMSAWRATRVARRFREPANPKTTLQVAVRRIFINATRWWLANGTKTRAAWIAYAVGKNFQGRNKLIALQVPALKGDVNLNDMVGTPGDASTLAPVSMVITPGVTQLSVAVTAPSAPSGWTITEVVGFVVLDSNWSTAGIDVKQTEAFDATTPYTLLFTDLTSAALYQVRAWINWLAPDATQRYSASIAGTGTPT